MQKQWESGIAYAEASDVGMRRANNQDSFVSVVSKTAEKFSSHGHLFVVADGMGAHAAGEMASQLATQYISQRYLQANGATEETLELAFVEANREIHRKGQSNPEFHNMGTTASGLVINRYGASIAHVGDSRIYRLRNDCFEQLTYDHSLVWEIESNPEIKLNSWSGPIPKNVITRSLGPNASVDIDIEGPFPVLPGDRFVLCSDGLTGVVEDDEIGALVGCLNPQDASRVLVDLANLRGGPDNITVTVVTVRPQENGSSPSMSDPPPSDATTSDLFSYFAIIGCSLIVIVAALFLLMLGSSWAYLPLILSLFAVIVSSLYRYRLLRVGKKQPVNQSALPKGLAPYRTYDARPTTDLYTRLGQTVQALRDASMENNWMMEWDAVDAEQVKGERHLSNGQADKAIQSQSKAILDAMKQLREQQNRAANETSIE